MIRITSLLAVAVAIAFGLTISAANAGGRHHSRSDCETRIFQKDETIACFRGDQGAWLFRKEAVVPKLLADDPDGEEAGGFSFGGLDCECQLRRRYDFICAGGDEAIIGSLDRRGRRMWSESLDGDEQQKFSGKRIDAQTCLK